MEYNWRGVYYLLKRICYWFMHLLFMRINPTFKNHLSTRPADVYMITDCVKRSHIQHGINAAATQTVRQGQGRGRKWSNRAVVSRFQIFDLTDPWPWRRTGVFRRTETVAEAADESVYPSGHLLHWQRHHSPRVQNQHRYGCICSGYFIILLAHTSTVDVRSAGTFRVSTCHGIFSVVQYEKTVSIRLNAMWTVS